MYLPENPPPAGRPRPGFVLALTLVAAMGPCGCASAQTRGYLFEDGCDPAAVVFVADGAGNFQGASGNLRTAVARECLPIEVRTFAWSHGFLRIVADQLDYPHARCEGRRMAEAVAQYHAEHPGVPIHLMGHSAGAAVAMSALECLPPGVVDRVFLISPSLSVSYDICPALTNVRCGLHVLYSRRDVFYLGLVTRIIGNSEGNRHASAGRLGFPPPSCDCAEAGTKLFQRGWDWRDVGYGNYGGHFGHHEPGYLRAYMLPYLLPDPPAVAAEP